MIDSAIFLLLVPGFFLALGIVLTILAAIDRQRATATWGAIAFIGAAVGATVDLFRPAGEEWLKWAALALHFLVLVGLSKAFLVRRIARFPRLAWASLAVPIAFLPPFGLDLTENVRTVIVQLAAFTLTAAVVAELVKTRTELMMDRIAIAVLALGSFSYLVRAFLFGASVTQDSAGRFFDDSYNIIFHVVSAGFGFLAGLALLVAIGVDTVLMHVRQSSLDPLTGLGNRRALDEAIDTEGQRKWRCGGVLVIDMDHFKSVNDRYGHPEGDRLLKAVAQSLNNRVGGCGHLCRMGGEEFVLLIEQRHRDRIEEIAAAAHEAVDGLRLDGALDGYRPTASVGFHSRNAGATLTEAIRFADQALYRAKSLGRDCVVGARHVNGITVMTEPPARQVG